jgi:putative redox protein
MDAKVVWSKEMTFAGSANSGFSVPLGADPSVGGANDGFRPLELMAVSLAGCTAMDVISILHKKQQHVTGFEVLVHADQRNDHPHVFTEAVITYRITGHRVDESALTRAIELSATKYCPAQSMLARVFPISLNYEIFETGSLEPEAVSKGTWAPKP